MAPYRNQRAAALPARLSRTWLLTSAADTSLFAPAMASEADSVVLDIEDAVPELSLIHISEPTRREWLSRMPSSA